MSAQTLRRDPAPVSMHGRRLDALWRISNNGALTEEDQTRALLAIAAAVIRPGIGFSAHLHRRDGGDAVLVETAARGLDPLAAEHYGRPGSTVALEDSPLLDVIRANATVSWADLAATPGLAARPVVLATGMRALIASPLKAADGLYLVSLAAQVPLDSPFEADDVHFVESLGTLLVKRLERRLQRARMLARADAERLHVVRR